MDEKIKQFDNSIETRRKIAERLANEGKFEDALSMIFSANDYEKDLNSLMDIADIYTNMGLLEQSNRYWFKYLTVAPSEKHSVAYEELATNLFYLEDIWASSYYFHKKIDIDGFISQDNLDAEIIDFFSGEEHKKALYHIAYPFDRADFSGKAKIARHSIAVGNYSDAIKILSKIPKECRDEDVFGDLATCCFLTNMLDEAVCVCKESLDIHKENITAYCNLCAIYNMKGDKEKGEYYYRKALQHRKGEQAEAYKIVTCAIECEDHLMAREFLKIILDERPYDLSMKFFYGIASINLHEYDLAEKVLSEVYRIDPTDKIVKYYLDLLKKLRTSGRDAEKLFPINYVRALPEKIERKRSKIIKELVNHPENITTAIKKAEVKDTIFWGLRCKNNNTMRETAFILSIAFNEFAKKTMLDALIDEKVTTEAKRTIIYALIINGYKEKFGVVASNIYIKVKYKRPTFYKQDDTMYIKAFALAMSRAVFFNVDNIAKLTSSANNVYKRLKDVVTEADVTSDELAALMIFGCEFKKFDDKRIVAQVFDIKKERFERLIALIVGEKNDKNN